MYRYATQRLESGRSWGRRERGEAGVGIEPESKLGWSSFHVGDSSSVRISALLNVWYGNNDSKCRRTHLSIWFWASQFFYGCDTLDRIEGSTAALLLPIRKLSESPRVVPMPIYVYVSNASSRRCSVFSNMTRLYALPCVSNLPTIHPYPPTLVPKHLP